MNLIKVNRALQDLASEGIDVAPLRAWVREQQASREGAVPTRDDTGWPLVTPESIEEHLGVAPRSGRTEELVDSGESPLAGRRPVLSCALAKGRMYTLSAAQRAVLREWFNMIPSPEVEVVEVAEYAPLAEPAGRYAREVTLRTTPHVSHGTVLNGPRVVTITRWGAFMSACAAHEREAEQSRAVARFTARIVRLLKRAKAEKVAHDVRTPGTLSYAWHAAVESKGLTEPEAVRDELRDLLLARGEHGLAKLVKEPRFVNEREDDDEYADLLKVLGV